MFALTIGQFEVADLLLAHGAAPNFVDSGSPYPHSTPVLHDAVKAAVLRSRRPRPIRSTGGDEQEQLRAAAERADAAFAVLRRVLESGADIHALDSYGNSALHRAVMDAQQILPVHSCSDPDAEPEPLNRSSPGTSPGSLTSSSSSSPGTPHRCQIGPMAADLGELLEHRWHELDCRDEPPATPRSHGDATTQYILADADAWASAVRTARAGGEGGSSSSWNSDVSEQFMPELHRFRSRTLLCRAATATSASHVGWVRKCSTAGADPSSGNSCRKASRLPSWFNPKSAVGGCRRFVVLNSYIGQGEAAHRGMHEQ
ncbi:ankyrin repeat domain-containing protein [Streptomyces sp. NPDC001732]